MKSRWPLLRPLCTRHFSHKSPDWCKAFAWPEALEASKPSLKFPDRIMYSTDIPVGRYGGGCPWAFYEVAQRSSALELHNFKGALPTKAQSIGFCAFCTFSAELRLRNKNGKCVWSQPVEWYIHDIYGNVKNQDVCATLYDSPHCKGKSHMLLFLFLREYILKPLFLSRPNFYTLLHSTWMNRQSITTYILTQIAKRFPIMGNWVVLNYA